MLDIPIGVLSHIDALVGFQTLDKFRISTLIQLHGMDWIANTIVSDPTGWVVQVK